MMLHNEVMWDKIDLEASDRKTGGAEMIYVTMTVGGTYGARFSAESDAEAQAEVKRRGYVVLDVIDGEDGEAIVVVR